MAHLLLFDLPGGDDPGLFQTAIELGHEITFCTSDLSYYRNKGPEFFEDITQANQIIDMPDMAYEPLCRQLDVIHAATPFDAVINVLDIRGVLAARVAKRYGLRYLCPDAAQLTRDKTRVRARLQENGIPQPAFAQVKTIEELMTALNQTGYPAILKPSDGLGSDNVYYLTGPESITEDVISLFQLSEGLAYGFGARSSQLYSVEPYMKGRLIGVDVFSDGRTRTMLGINAKKMCPPPSFAIAGSTYSSQQFDDAVVREFAFSVLDAIGFDFGACHIEMIVHEEGVYVVEINARLVNAQIPYQMSYALDRSVYADFIHLHLGMPLSEMPPFARQAFSVIRWVVADRHGVLEEIGLPDMTHPQIERVVMFKGEGDTVQPPMSNQDRIGYVIVTAETEEEGVRLADEFVNATRLRIASCSAEPCQMA